MKYDIWTTSTGENFGHLGHPDGWGGISRQFFLDTYAKAPTGFEADSDSEHQANSIPPEWEAEGFLWCNFRNLAPSHYFWKEVGADEAALQRPHTRPMNHHEILNYWFSGDKHDFMRAVKSATGILRHTGGRGGTCT